MKLIAAIFYGVVFNCFCTLINAQQPTVPFHINTPLPGKLKTFPLGSVKPTGWLKQQLQENLDGFTQDAVDVVNQMLRQASEKNDYTRMGKLQKMGEVLRQASTPPEVEFIEHLLDAPDDASLERMMGDNADMVNDQFMEALIGLVAQVDQAAEQGNPEAKAISEKLNKIYKTGLKFSMKKNLQ